ncbi:NAD(P)H-binding protein [Streptomyces sp. NPDC047315]|uniref:NmrA family NAD(P)-binding protein n=1 Tax=Streptomyces sp. NPDC047315 TaxID=3155142 RepID=UPI0033C522CD
MSYEKQTYGTEAARTYLVTSATGKNGRRVARRLADRGVTVREGSRRGETVFDWQAPETWTTALRGVNRVFVSYYPDLASAGAADAMRAFGRAAAEAGVERLVLLSGRGEPGSETSEAALRDAGVPLTVVRSSWFAQNFNEGEMARGVDQGEIVFPAGDTPEPFVDLDDVADVLVAALTEEGTESRTYEVTGPRLLTFADVAAEISRASGREVRYVPVSADEYRALLTEHGVPQDVAQWTAYLFAALLDGHNASTTTTVRDVLGREPRDFTEYARRAWADGAA